MPFPVSPNPGDSYTDAYGTVWIYAGSVNGWYRQQVSTPNDTSYTSAISGPAGSNTQVQFNDNGFLAGDSGLTFNKTTNALSGGAFIPTGSTVPTNGVYLPASNSLALATNSQGRVFIDSTGRVGLGSSTPGQLLHLQGTSPALQFEPALDTQNSLLIFRNAADSSTKGLIYYNHSNDSLNFATNGTATDVIVDSSGRVGVGSTSPAKKVDVLVTPASSGDEGLRVTDGTRNVFMAVTGSTYSYKGVGGNETMLYGAGGPLNLLADETFIKFCTNTSEKARIDTSGRLLVGTTSADANYRVLTATDFTPSVQIKNTETIGLAVNRTDGPVNISIASSNPASSGNSIGRLIFNQTDGTNFLNAAHIEAQVDGTPGSNDMPGRLVFSTTADGQPSPTERMRITSDGQVQFGDSTTRNRAITSETDYYASGRNRLSNSWFVLRKGYKAVGSSVAAEATITLSASAGSPEAFHKIRVIQSGALTRAYYEFLVSESSGTFSIVQDLSNYNKAQFTVSMSSPTLTITSGTAAIDFVFLQVEIETFAMGAAEPTISFATV